MKQETPAAAPPAPLDELLSVVRKDYSKLGVRIRTLEHTETTPHPATTIRVHYPSLRAGKATVEDLVALLVDYMVPFALPRSQIYSVQNQYGILPVDEYDHLRDKLRNEAKDTFKRASKVTNRNGEAGELLLYLLTEWLLEAPQLLAKMPLKTNPNMPVHGSDGIHVKFCSSTGRLLFFWGESKLYANVNSAIDKATESICEALTDKKLSYEFTLVNRNIELSGLGSDARAAILSYLDPLDERSNERFNITTCLIGFDFVGYAKLGKLKAGEVDKKFCEEIRAKLPAMAVKLADSMGGRGIEGEALEVFFFPVPSVQNLRDLFQAEIGWGE